MEVLSHSPNQSPTMSPTMDHFNFNRLSPYLSAPSSPKRFGEDFYLSAPTSPSRFLSQFEDEEEDVGFAFCVNRDSDSSPRSAEELFFGGKIKPLESSKSPLLSSPNRVKKSPISKGKKAIMEAFSPTKHKKDHERRGRDRTPASEFSSTNSGRRVTRSHSPYRTSKYTWVEEQQRNHQQQQQQHSNNKEDSSVPVTKSSSRIWRLRDFLLFRSASEGRGTSKDPFRKYSVSYNNNNNKKVSEEGKSGSSSSSILPPIPPRSRRKENGVSAHELHYARKKAESEDLKKRTFLPYKQGILGRLAGLGSNTR